MQVQTGDILFVRGEENSAIDEIIMSVTHSPYSHVAMVVVDPWWDSNLKGTYVIQSDMMATRSSESGENVAGVSLSPMSDLHNAKVDIRRLSGVSRTTDQFRQHFTRVHAQVHNVPYDTSILDWVWGGLSHLGFTCFRNTRHSTDFWCSALVSYIYVQMGWLPETVNWSNMAPQDLVTCETVQPAVLGPIEMFQL